jgi:hypothetical protein
MISHERTVDLNIDPDTVKMLAEKAKAAAIGLDQEMDHGVDNQVEFDPDRLTDRHQHDGLAEEEEDNLTREEFIELIEDLNTDEIAELTAIAWIGRGDYSPEEWADALSAAQDRGNDPHPANYLLSMPQLAAHLENGLDSLNIAV